MVYFEMNEGHASVNVKGDVDTVVIEMCLLYAHMLETLRSCGIPEEAVEKIANLISTLGLEVYKEHIKDEGEEEKKEENHAKFRNWLKELADL